MVMYHGLLRTILYYRVKSIKKDMASCGYQNYFSSQIWPSYRNMLWQDFYITYIWTYIMTIFNPSKYDSSKNR